MQPKETQVKAKKGLFKIVFSRIGIIALAIILQIAILFISVQYLREYLPYIYGLLILVESIVIIHLINSVGNPAFKMTWILLILMFPGVGMLFYLYVKIQPGSHILKGKLAAQHIETEPYRQQNPSVLAAIKTSKSANSLLAHYLHRQLGFPTYQNTDVKYFALGEEKFEEMLIQLKQARKFIFLEYFIVKEGYMWNSILDILVDKVKKGVEVRFMYDGLGSLTTLPWDYHKQMERLGIKCKVMGSLKPFLSTIQNNRDHRKILVIDGRVAFTGGINLSDEYINRVKRFGHWKDTAIMLEGDGVQSFTMMFLEMWNAESKETENYRKYLTRQSSGFQRGLGYVIPYADSPFDNENVGEEVYFHMLNHAKKYVHIMTPYLILDNEMITTLTRAAKSGIEVVIIMPHIPDKWYAYAVAKTYYKELIMAGVQIYEYNPGFIHAKVFVSDDDTAAVGTINLDYRSLYLHFECGAFIYNNMEVHRIEMDFQNTLKRCHKVSMMEVEKRSWYYILMGKALRLFAPLM
ncbi:cardiolipin synthase [Aequitasia blattaphilus]|uniref:Cardiolipin synthase n=1 Tax=Aequitasia blattaphilus TaxID=2949332 RepID=A0ABT1E6K0_9FIRM|nr:cardiolipin synthase [Aequitasia blattaphilus]MCP1101214.1 cardiolipin synthase [Aequitasia blattaphilus]MCR8613854.1 cardiolipin synthase [Aequitasia blattaphilus]